MIARLLQLTTLGLLTAALVALVWLWRAGHPWIGASVATLLVFGHAAVLAVEFLLMRRVNRLASGSEPGLTAQEMFDAWRTEVWQALVVFCWRQPFRSGAYPDCVPPKRLPKPQRGVLLVHGYVCNRGIWNPWLQRLRSNGTPFVALNLEPAFGGIDDCTPCIGTGVQRLTEATGCAPLIVAHSMGGLAVRRWWTQPGNLHRVAHVITLGTPHHGTWLARFASSSNARQMQTRSPWLTCLHNETPTTCAALITCYYSNADNIVFPAASATLPGADNRLLHGVPHVAMVDDCRIWADVQQRLHV